MTDEENEALSKSLEFREKLLPIQWTGGWDGDPGQCITLYGVLFVEDFGVFKAGERIPDLTIDYDNGCIQHSDDKGNLIKKQKIKFFPTDAHYDYEEEKDEAQEPD